MTTNKKEEFDLLVKDIVENEAFTKSGSEPHHGITRFEHSMRVAKYTYLISKFFHMKNSNDATRAALLHDFYVFDDMKGQSSARQLQTHPMVALNNSLKYFELNDMQKDIIKSHMFPCNLDVPKYKESWLVSLIDKVIGGYEIVLFKAPLYMGIYMIFLFELIKIPNK